MLGNDPFSLRRFFRKLSLSQIREIHPSSGLIA
jgi:hypothetical protein